MECGEIFEGLQKKEVLGDCDCLGRTRGPW